MLQLEWKRPAPPKRRGPFDLSVLWIGIAAAGRNPHQPAWAAKNIRLLAAPAELAIGRRLVRPCKARRSAGQSLGRNNAEPAHQRLAPLLPAPNLSRPLSTSATPARRQQSTLGAASSPIAASVDLSTRQLLHRLGAGGQEAEETIALIKLAKCHQQSGAVQSDHCHTPDTAGASPQNLDAGLFLRASFAATRKILVGHPR
jgi:hypothetical protein